MFEASTVPWMGSETPHGPLAARAGGGGGGGGSAAAAAAAVPLVDDDDAEMNLASLLEPIVVAAAVALSVLSKTAAQ